MIKANSQKFLGFLCDSWAVHSQIILVCFSVVDSALPYKMQACLKEIMTYI